MWTYYRYDELYHHGILGQRWGVRRFQNKDGSLTSAGKKRYRTDSDKSKEELIDEKIRNKLNKETKISKTRQKHIDEYLAKGFTKEESEIAAYKRERTRKILVATAGITVTAIAAYVAYKHYDQNVDKFIKSGTILNNISRNSNQGVRDAFYATISERDSTKYRGIYGNDIRGIYRTNPVFEKKINAITDLKVASSKSATNVLKDIVSKNPNYMKDLENILINNKNGLRKEAQQRILDKGIRSLQKGKINKSVYEALNLSLGDHTSSTQNIADVFYEGLKSKGYDAIKDINDSNYSGYFAKTAHIVFNNSKVNVGDVRRLTNEEIDENIKRGYKYINQSIATRKITSIGTKLAAAGEIYIFTKYFIDLRKQKKDEEKVIAYRKEHPNSELSSKEILRTIS